MVRRSVIIPKELDAKIVEFSASEKRKFSPSVVILLERALREIERKRKKKAE